MKQFLIVYDRRRGQILELREFTEPERERALRERFAAERLHRNRPDVEVVLLGAASKRMLQRTHSRYFKSAGELMAGSV